MKNILFALFICIALVSCEKVIELDLGNGETQFSVEAYLFDSFGSLPIPGTEEIPFTNLVIVTETSGVFDPFAIKGVEEATVTITDDAGNVHELTSLGDGLYSNFNLVGEEGVTYTLKVEKEGKVVSGSSTLPKRVGIDDFYSEKDPFSDFDPDNDFYNLRCDYTDPADRDDFYLWRVYQNTSMPDTGLLIVNNYVSDDLFNDGKETYTTFFQEFFDPGDTVTMQMMAVEEPVYQYYLVLQQLGIQGLGATTPGNPPYNMVGDGFGIFSASSFDTKTTVVVAE